MGVSLQPTFYVDSVRKIGEGGFGVVDEVVVTRSSDPAHPVGMRLARKALGPQWRNDTQAETRFEREIKQLQRMSHPNIVKVEGVSITTDRFYLMRLYRGSLRRLLGPQHPLGVKFAVHMGHLIGEALQHAHGLGIVHRDLKPDNILMGDSSEPIVADWGLGQFVHQYSTVLTNAAVGGTQWYCPPEQWTGRSKDPRADVYSLGVTIGEALLGRLPLRAPFLGIDTDLVPENRQLSRLLRTMTSPDVNLRPNIAEATSLLCQVCGHY